MFVISGVNGLFFFCIVLLVLGVGFLGGMFIYYKENKKIPVVSIIGVSTTLSVLLCVLIMHGFNPTYFYKYTGTGVVSAISKVGFQTTVQFEEGFPGTSYNLTGQFDVGDELDVRCVRSVGLEYECKLLSNNGKDE